MVRDPREGEEAQPTRVGSRLITDQTIPPSQNLKEKRRGIAKHTAAPRCRGLQGPRISRSLSRFLKKFLIEKTVFMGAG